MTNVNTPRGGEKNHSIGLPPNALPKSRSSRTGVSVSYVPDPEKKWYVMRASYGRELKAMDIIVEDGTYAYVAQRYTITRVHGKTMRQLQPLVPNLIFVYTTADQAESYVKDTPKLSYLSYYYNHFERSEHDHTKNTPLTIPENDMMNFIIATSTRSEHLLVVTADQCRFKGGETVRVTDGAFAGITGRVARVAGQQRVVIQLTGLGLISTAYIPTAFIERITPL